MFSPTNEVSTNPTGNEVSTSSTGEAKASLPKSRINSTLFF